MGPMLLAEIIHSRTSLRDSNHPCLIYFCIDFWYFFLLLPHIKAGKSREKIVVYFYRFFQIFHLRINNVYTLFLHFYSAGEFLIFYVRYFNIHTSILWVSKFITTCITKHHHFFVFPIMELLKFEWSVTATECLLLLPCLENAAAFVSGILN